jgi:hypothetical protein
MIDIRHYSSGSRSACLFAAATIGLMSLAIATTAAAQAYDHLKCFKIRDESTFSSANVDLEPLPAEFGVSSCTIKSRAKEFCVPAGNDVTMLSDGSLQSVESEELALNRLCYKLKCPDADVDPIVVSDQFGTRTISGYKSVKLCTPAIIGDVPVSLDDSFDGASLDPSWTVLHPELATISVSGGALRLTPTASGAPGIWYNSGEGPLVHKDVTGDFDVFVSITTRDPANAANPPPPEYRLAGILARDPASTPASENTVHVALGAGASGQGTCYEYKSTDNSISTWLATPTASATAQLRLVRSGTMIEMHWRALSTDAWTMIYSVNRPDLPATLQVGPMIYAVDAPPSIEALFDEIVFQ